MRLEILNQFNFLKQGDTKSEFKFKLLDYNDQSVDLTNQTVSVVIANSITVLFEKAPQIDDAVNGIISFSFNDQDITGYGDMRLEVHVIDANNATQIFPSQGYYKFVVEKSLSNIANGVTNITLKYFEDKFDARVAQLEVAINDAQEATFATSQAIENANTAKENADIAATNANNSADNADTKATLADQKASLADTKATEANIATSNANVAATNANNAASAANTAKANADMATTQANAARDNANTAATNANAKATLAQTAADRVDQAIAAGTQDLEVKDSRGTFANLRQRLDDTSTRLTNLANFVDADTGKKYKWNLKQQGGHMILVYEEVL